MASWRVEPLTAFEGIDAILELQRAMALARNESELIEAFARHFHAASGATEMLAVEVVDDGLGTFRITGRMVFATGAQPEAPIRPADSGLTSGRDSPVLAGGVIGTLVRETDPSLVRDVDPAGDPALGRWIEGPRDIIAVPIAGSGGSRATDRQAARWRFLLRPPNEDLEAARVRSSVALLNMYARSIALLRLGREIGGLHDEARARLAEVAEVQQSILPARTPDHPAIEVAARYRPFDLAGGDYYDFRTFPGGDIGFVVADVSGHGPAAAVVMAMLRTAMSVTRDLEAANPSVASQVNELMSDGLRGGTFVTAIFVRLNPETGDGEYVNAGHCPAMIRRADGCVEVLDEDGSPPIGVLPEIDSIGAAFTLNPGDSLLLYTDGITEAFSRDRELFGEARLATALGRVGQAHEPSDDVITPIPDADTLADAILSAVDAHAGPARRADDQCLVVVRYLGGGAAGEDAPIETPAG